MKRRQTLNIYTARRSVVGAPSRNPSGNYVPGDVDMPAHVLAEVWRRGVTGRRYLQDGVETERLAADLGRNGDIGLLRKSREKRQRLNFQRRTA